MKGEISVIYVDTRDRLEGQFRGTPVVFANDVSLKGVSIGFATLSFNNRLLKLFLNLYLDVCRQTIREFPVGGSCFRSSVHIRGSQWNSFHFL